MSSIYIAYLLYKLGALSLGLAVTSGISLFAYALFTCAITCDDTEKFPPLPRWVKRVALLFVLSLSTATIAPTQKEAIVYIIAKTSWSGLEKISDTEIGQLGGEAIKTMLRGYIEDAKSTHQ